MGDDVMDDKISKGSQPETPDYNELRAKLLNPELSSSEAAIIGQVITNFRTIAEAHKLDREAAKLNAEAENLARTAKADARRFQLTVLAPLITAIAVAAGLGVQVYQVDRNTKLQRDLNESVQFKDAIAMASSKDPLQSIAGSVLVKRMTHLEGYKNEGREIAIGVLSQPPAMDSFNLFFPTVRQSTDWKNYRDVVAVSQRLSEAYGIELDVLQALGEKNKNSKAPEDPQKTAHEKLKDDISKQQDMVADLLAELIRNRPASFELDYTGAKIWNADLSKVSFRGLILENATIGFSIVDDADFAGVRDTDHINWQGTAWWRAKNIPPKMLAHLIADFPFDKGGYPGTAPDLNEYCRGIRKFGARNSLCSN
jgi:hypothetical protein